MPLYLGSESMQITMGVTPPANQIVEALTAGNISYYSNDRISYLGQYVGATDMRTINLPNCISVEARACYGNYNLSFVSLPKCSYIGSSAFYSCGLRTGYFPECIYINASAFFSCYSLSYFSASKCSYIGSWTFCKCSTLLSCNFPNYVSISGYVFSSCYKLSVAYIPNCTYIGAGAFNACYNLISLYLTSVSSTFSIPSTGVFNSTPISNYSASAGQYGSIYVPSSLYSSFITTYGWSWFSSKIVGMYWNQLVNETCSIGSVTLDGTNYYLGTILSNYNAISASTLKITLNEQEYICSQYSGTMYNYTTYGYGASADFTTMTPYVDTIHPFLLFCQDRGNIFVNSLVISSDIAKKDDVMSIIIEEQVNCLP